MRTINLRRRSPNGVLAFDLRDLLEAIGPGALEASWTASEVDCVGPRAEELHEVSDRGLTVDGVTLLRIAEEIDQVIDGRFTAARLGEAEPHLVLLCIDSTSWDVSCSDEEVLDAVRGMT